MSFWERLLVNLHQAADESRKRLYRDRKASIALKNFTGDHDAFLAERDSIRLRKECEVGISKIIADQRKGVQQGYDMALERHRDRMTAAKVSAARGAALTRDNRVQEALVEFEKAARLLAEDAN